MSLFRAILEKPWKQQTASGLPAEGDYGSVTPPQKVGLLFFIAVVAVMFALFITAYFVRMELDDWRPMPESQLLWLNTVLLFLSSFTLQWTHNVLKKGQDKQFKIGLILGALFTVAFVYGQITVWGQMQEAGYYLYNNPANAFFYVLTGIHAIHVLGGLFVWTKTIVKYWSGAEHEELELSTELCALYWHFLLLVWLVLFALVSYT
ncbi:MAG: cytochrome c oxidase subunit 3 [Gammaproteobacteria bacterium]|nr:cytochrome c oxidase subunit 3 [Gammaproteobacteria bacterium]